MAGVMAVTDGYVYPYREYNAEPNFIINDYVDAAPQPKLYCVTALQAKRSYRGHEFSQLNGIPQNKLPGEIIDFF